MKQETKCYCGHTTYCDCGPEEPKQETLEEFIESQPYYGTCTYEYKEGIEEGAKWQQERMYSEEEVISLLVKREYALDLYDMANDYEDAVKWFEQFKKR